MLWRTDKLNWHKLHICCYTTNLASVQHTKKNKKKKTILSVCCVCVVGVMETGKWARRGNISCNSHHDLVSLRISATDKEERWVLLTLWEDILSPASKIFLPQIRLQMMFSQSVSHIIVLSVDGCSLVSCFCVTNMQKSEEKKCEIVPPVWEHLMIAQYSQIFLARTNLTSCLEGKNKSD